MSRFSTAVLLIAGVAVAAIPARAVVLENSSFESEVLPADTYCITFTSPMCAPTPGWSGDFYLVSGAPGPLTPPLPLPDGNQFAMIQTTGGMEQSVTIDVAGNYALWWWAAGRGAYIGASGNDNYNITFDGELQGMLTAGTSSPWLLRTLTITAVPGTFALRIDGTTSQGDNSVLFDDFVISYLPEPGLVGSDAAAALALAAFVVRRRAAEG